MTATSPYPEANPFNERKFGNYNINKAAQGFYISHTGKDAKNLKVPNQDQPMYGTPEWNKKYEYNRNLTPPETAPDTNIGKTSVFTGFIPNYPDLFAMHDGTIISFKTGRIVRKAPAKSNIINTQFQIGEWEPTQSIEQLMSKMDNLNNYSQNDPNIDIYSMQYWKKAAEEAKKLEDNMTPEQKFYLKSFEEHFPKSRFIDESLKNKC